MNLRKKVSSETLYTEYINILNGVLQLSKRESEVLSFMLAIDGSGERNVNSRNARVAMTGYLGISESNLSRYLNTIKNKGLIVREPDGVWVINDNIRPSVTSGILELTITLDTDEVPRQADKGFSKEAQQGS
jgi:hypothetical protein